MINLASIVETPMPAGRLTDMYACPMRGCRRKRILDHADIKQTELRCRCGARMMFEKTCREISGTISTVQTSRPVEVL